MAASFSIAYTATPLAASTKLAIYATPQMLPGITYIKPSLLRLLFTSAAAAASPANVLAAYNAMFGTLVAGRKIRVRTVVLNITGGRSIANDQIITVA